MNTKRVALVAAALLSAVGCGDNNIGKEGTEATTPDVGALQTALDIDGERQTNQFFGSVTFTNAPGAVETLLLDNIGTAGCYIDAASSSHPGLFAAVIAPAATPPSLSCDYVLSAETQEGGVTYNLNAAKLLNNWFWFPSNVGSVLYVKGSVEDGLDSVEGTEVNFAACPGLAELRFIDDCTGTEVFPTSNVSSDGKPYFRDVVSGRWYVVLEDGFSGNVVVRFASGSDPALDLISHREDVAMVGSCDGIDPHELHIACGGDSGALGAFDGPYDVLGETEKYALFVRAHAGPEDNYRDFNDFDGLPPLTRPVSAPADWWTLVNMPPGEYHGLFAWGAIREGYGYTWFQTSVIDPSLDGDVVIAGTTVTPSRSAGDGSTVYPFVMNPALLQGDIHLVNPSLPDLSGSIRTWEHLVREADNLTLPENIPANPFPHASTSLRAFGNGFASTSFPNDFDPTPGVPGTHALTSVYELPVMSSYDETLNWQRDLQLTFRSTSTDPVEYRNGTLYMAIPGFVSLLTPGQATEVDYEACFNEVRFVLSLLGGDELFSPSVQIGGSFNGFEDEPSINKLLDYSVSGSFSGTPLFFGEQSATGSVAFTLPRGAYTLAPAAQVVTPEGNVNGVNFSSLSVELGCGQIIEVGTVAVSVSTASECATSPETPISVSVDSDGAEVGRVWYVINGGAEVDICSGACGADPTFSVALANTDLLPCGNTVQVFATSQARPDLPSSTTINLINEIIGDGIDCQSDCGEEPEVDECPVKPHHKKKRKHGGHPAAPNAECPPHPCDHHGHGHGHGHGKRGHTQHPFKHPFSRPFGKSRHPGHHDQ
jgi:hypothetical protein